MNLVPLPPLTVDQVIISAGSEWPAKWKGWAWIQLIQGHAYWNGANGFAEMEHGRPLVAIGGDGHAIRASRLGDATIAYLWFSGESLAAFLTPSERDVVDRSLKNNYKCGTRLELPGGLHNQFSKLCQGSLPGSKFKHKTLLLGLIGHFLESEFPPVLAEECNGNSATCRFNRLIESISEAEMISQPLAYWANKCSCSAKYFQRLYFKKFGVPLRTKVRSARLEKARILLMDGVTSPLEAAKQSGFQSYIGFVGHFRDQFNVTPEAYVSSIRKMRGASEKLTDGIPLSSRNTESKAKLVSPDF